MSGDQVQILVAMGIYLVAVIVIGIFYMKTANESSDNYFIGGRKLGPWIAAMSAEASERKNRIRPYWVNSRRQRLTNADPRVFDKL